MIARYTSYCPVCNRDIKPGLEIGHERGLGWVHRPCQSILDDPVSQDDLDMTYGEPTNIQTYRQLAEHNLMAYHMDDDPYDDPYGFPAGGPIDHEDMPWGW
jgi:hypothetical protein